LDVARPATIRVMSELPIDDLWSYYRRYEVIDFVQSRDGSSQTHAEEAGHCVRQAREYFRSARSAPLLTRPVLLYYGMVSLGKLLLLLDEKTPMSMDDIEVLERHGGHGLKQYDPKPPDVGDGAFHLERSLVEVTIEQGKKGSVNGRGIFPQLAARVTPTGGMSWLGQRFTLEEILRAIPQLDLHMRQAFGEDKGFTGLVVANMTWSADRSVYKLEISREPSAPKDAEEAQRRIAYLDPSASPVTTGNDPYDPFTIPVEGAIAYSVVAREELTRTAQVLPATLYGERFDGLLAQYMAMYALSIVARYKPHRWAEILEGRRSPLLPVLERLMATAERWWPNLVLNRLEGAWVLFAPASYLS